MSRALITSTHSNGPHSRDVTFMLPRTTLMVSVAYGYGPDSAHEVACGAHLRMRPGTPPHAIRGTLRSNLVGHAAQPSAAVRPHGRHRRSRVRGNTPRIPCRLAETEDGSATRRSEQRWHRQYGRCGTRRGPGIENDHVSQRRGRADPASRPGLAGISAHGGARRPSAGLRAFLSFPQRSWVSNPAPRIRSNRSRSSSVAGRGPPGPTREGEGTVG